jgi:hypothetical protein
MDTRTVNVIVCEAAEKIARIEQGTILPHTTIEEMIGERRLNPRSRYYQLFGKVRRELIRTYGLFLKTVQKTGYEICKHGDEIDLCTGKVKTGMKIVGRATAESQCIRVGEIKDSEKRTRTIETAQKLSNIYGMLKQGQSGLMMV